MLTVIIALFPAAMAGCVFFGPRAAAVLAVCIAACVIFEALCRIVMKKDQTIGDLSAVVTGLLLGMNLPATVPFYVAVIGSFVAIVVVKQLFGGIGQNFANPAIAARIVLMLSFTPQMSNWVKPYWYSGAVDAETSATPLAAEWLEFQDTTVYSVGTSLRKMAPFTLPEMFWGETGGCIGETCAAMLILGGLFLIVIKVISPATPIAFIGSFAVLSTRGGTSHRRVLYGYRLCHNSPHDKGQDCFRYRLRPGNVYNPKLRKLPRGSFLLHTAYEPAYALHRQADKSGSFRSKETCQGEKLTERSTSYV